MFYEFSDDIVTVEPENISQNFIAAGYVLCDEIDKIADIFDFSQQSVIQCRADNKYFRTNIEVYEDYSFATLKIINAQNSCVDSDGIAFYIKKNLFIVVDVYDSDCSVRDKFLKCLGRFSPSNVSLEKLIFAFFESIIDGDSRFLEDTEFYINEMEEAVLKDKTRNDFNIKLLSTKKLLLLLRNYYEQLIDISESLEENENELFDRRELHYFKIFNSKAQRLKDNVDMLRDSVIHLKDAYESSLELKLNQTMKIFTMFTVIFSPLSLIAGWYGMNFNSMPEFSWKWGYAFVIGLSLLTAAIILIIFKKKKWI